MKILYLDCPMGISGDMFLAALIDLGADSRAILREIEKLGLGPVKVKIAKETRHSITATSFRAAHMHEHRHRTFKDIKNIISASALSKEVKDLSVAIFKNIAAAEGRIHGISAQKVHFHEVGAMDSIIDIVGAAVAVTSLKADRVISSPIPLGSGWAKTMHGTLPIPAPATVELLKGVPVLSSDAPFELTTPTGAAIVKTIASGFGPIPDMIIEDTGYGAGKKDFKERANVLRAVTGVMPDGLKGLGPLRGLSPHADNGQARGAEKLFMIETNIDDMSPQIAGYLMETLFAAGALDVYFTPVQMKKTRPGILLSALAEGDRVSGIVDAIFRESTSIGVRSYAVERHCLGRKTVKVKTPYGTVGFKVSLRNGKPVNIQPEYDECRAIAAKKKVPLKEVIDAAKAAFRKK
ncbi:MAG: nickel pincer cofactor biosynthesis protein LarC [Deltaproteobacteria bacterium]|nr:nickel pincer cofactor biosynthesis protein LarC [Deltaproteobacteria bacterium]